MLYGVSPPKKGSEFLAETHVFTKGEEIANAITHGIGAVLSIAGLVMLIVYSLLYGTAWHVVSFTIFGVTTVTLYLCSTMLHAPPKGKVKDLFEIFDHSAIYLFIAGTYTPPTFIVIKDRKSTRLNSSHVSISYAVFCLKKKKIEIYKVSNMKDA